MLLAEMHVEFVRDEDGTVRTQIRSKRWAGATEFLVSPIDYNKITREVTLLQHGNVASLRSTKKAGKLALEVDKPCDSE